MNKSFVTLISSPEKLTPYQVEWLQSIGWQWEHWIEPSYQNLWVLRGEKPVEVAGDPFGNNFYLIDARYEIPI